MQITNLTFNRTCFAPGERIQVSFTLKMTEFSANWVYLRLGFDGHYDSGFGSLLYSDGPEGVSAKIAKGASKKLSFEFMTPDANALSASKLPGFEASRSHPLALEIHADGSGSAQFVARSALTWLKSRLNPVLSNVTFADLSGGFARFGAYVQGQSRLRVSAAETLDPADPELTILSRTLALNGSVCGDSLSAIPAASGSVPWVYTITDSAGKSQSASGTLTVLPYSPPQLTDFTVRRVRIDAADDGSETFVPDDGGERVQITLSGAAAALRSLNRWTLQISFGPENGAMTTRTLASGPDGANLTYIDDPACVPDPISASARYAFTLTLTDFFTSATLTAWAEKAAACLDVEKHGVSVGMRSTGTSSAKKFEVASDYDARFYGPAHDKHGAELCGASLELSAPPTAAVSLATGAYVDTVIFTAPRSGLYAISYTCMFSSNATGWRFAALIVDGKSIATARGAAVASARYINLTGFARLAAGQTVAAEHAQNSGATLTVTHAQLQAVRIGA